MNKPLTVAFAGLRHGHILGLFDLICKRNDLKSAGAWEENDAARIAAQKAGLSCCYKTYDALLADPAVDVVAIGDYYGRRGELALRALRAGKHVLADKPLCADPAELDAIRQEAAARHLTVGIMLDLRTSPNMVTALAAVRSGLIGRVNNIIFEGQHPLLYGSRPGWYFEKGKYTGLFNDIAIHGIDAARLLTGSEVQTVVGARTWNFYAAQEPDFPDSGQLLVKMENGAGVMGDVSYAAPDSQGYTHPAYWHFRVWGDRGCLSFAYAGDGVTACLNGQDRPCRLPDVPAGRIWLDDFVQAIHTEDPAYTADMLTSQEAVLRIEAAAIHE